MTKTPLLPPLPREYVDSATKTSIYHALKPYENPGSDNVVNPQMKWDLHKAWNDAQELLAHSRWHYNDSHVVEKENAEYELAADTDEEMDRVNTIIAGIVAFQMLNPKEKISIHRIEHKKGGEMNVTVSHVAALELKKKNLSLQLLDGSRQEKAPIRSFLKLLMACKK